MRFSAARLATALVLVTLVAAGIPGAAAGQSGTPSTVMTVALEPDGDARWTVTALYPLATPNETAAFNRLADEHAAGETDVLSADPYRNAAALASESTGRQMAIEGIEPTASRTNSTGALRLSFTWTSFAQVTDGGDRLVLGDVFMTPSGTWLPELREGQVLVIEFPAGYTVDSVSRGLDNGTIRVMGPQSFEPGQPSAILERAAVQPTTPVTSTPVIGGQPSALSIGAALIVLLLVGYLAYRRQEGESDDTGGAVADDPAPEPTDEELLSDEERVLRLLRAEGGRMKQVDIVDETDWSNAKVSQLLTSMADAGRVEKLRIGRENLISLPDADDD